MKNVFLSVVIICALTIAGVGGTLATWSDSEVSMSNQIVTGSVDLKVNDADDLPYGSGVGSIVTIDGMVPCREYGPFPVTLWNAGIHDSKIPAHAYIHFKDHCCSNAPPKPGSGYAEAVTGFMKPEPELVAEHGGKVDCIDVPGIGVVGDDCSMLSHVSVRVTKDRKGLKEIVGPTQLGNMLCQEIYLFDLKPCNAKTIYLWFKLRQDSEEDFTDPDTGVPYNFIKHPDQIPGLVPGTPMYDQALLHWMKFNDWPSWALMRDQVTFNVEFDLWLDCEGVGPYPTSVG